MKHRLQALAFLIALTIASCVPAQTYSSTRSDDTAEPVKTDAATFKQKTSADKEPPPLSSEDMDGRPRHQEKPIFFKKGPEPLAPIDPGGPGCCQSGACPC